MALTKLISIDFETYYDNNYNLKKLTIEEYVRSGLFEALCLGVAPHQEEEFCIAQSDIKTWLESQDWSTTAIVFQNAYFDAFILNHVYNVRPAFIFDTMSMARAIYGPLQRCDLGSLAEKLNVGAKTVPYSSFAGKHWSDIPISLRLSLMNGCKNDAAITLAVFRQLAKIFPKQEYDIIDLTVRMFTEPVIEGDSEALRSCAEEELNRKQQLLDRFGITEADVQSVNKFVNILESYGETVPRKQMKSGLVPCLAKTDPYTIENASRQDVIGELLRLRLDVKSTIAETRAARLADIASRGRVPVYLHYAKAVTKRWSGGDGVNMQNLPRGSSIRKALRAPKGAVFIILDFKQIEYRVLCGLAGQADKLEALSDPGRDLYCEFGSHLFGRDITKADKDERQFSKIIVLSSGYGAGKARAAKAAKVNGFDLSETITNRAIDLYRQQHRKVVNFWGLCDRLLDDMHNDCGEYNHDGVFTVKGNRVTLPNGLWADFDLKRDESGRLLRKVSNGVKSADCADTNYAALGYTPYWGGAFTEFLCQSIARVYLSSFIKKVHDELSIRPCLLVHDEYVCLYEKDAAHAIVPWLKRWASEPVGFWPNGPQMDVDVTISPVYDK
jgi:DNA polymerase